MHKLDWLESLRPLRPSIKNTSAKLFSETVQGLVHGDGNEEGHETHQETLFHGICVLGSLSLSLFFFNMPEF